MNHLSKRAPQMLLRQALVGLTAWLAVSAPAFAKPGVRATMATQVGTTGQVHPRLAVTAGVGGQFLLKESPPNDRAGAFADVGVASSLHDIVTVTAGYHYGYGTFTWDSPGQQEHRGSVGLRVATRGRKVFFVNRTDLNLRGVELHGRWRFAPRIHEEMRLTAAFHPAIGLSVFSEILMHVRDPWRDLVQLRPGLAVHGEIPLARKDAGKARDVNLFWFAGQQVGLYPVALALPPKQTDETDILAVMTADHATTVELRTSFSLAVLW